MQIPAGTCKMGDPPKVVVGQGARDAVYPYLHICSTPTWPGEGKPVRGWRWGKPSEENEEQRAKKAQGQRWLLQQAMLAVVGPTGTAETSTPLHPHYQSV